MNHYAQSMDRPVSEIDVDSRATFINRTYLHLAGAIMALIGLEAFFLTSGIAEKIVPVMGKAWWAVLIAFMALGWLGQSIAMRAKTLPVQYAGLAIYVVLEAIILLPLLWIANSFAPGLIESAALITGVMFAGLTAIAMWTKKDFSFMRGILMWAGIGAVGLIFGSMIFGFQLGVFFSVGMCLLAGGYILYETSNILHHYPEDRYVAASLGLFASVAMLFFYVLRILLAMSSSD